MKVYFAGVVSKELEGNFIKKKASRLFSYIDLIDNTRGYGAENRFEEFGKAKKKRKKK
jgi:hypothetical protein